MLRRGEFDAKRYKVLVLPMAVAIGRKEAEVIRSFVRQGGTLIADVRAGICDGRCKPLDKGLLGRPVRHSTQRSPELDPAGWPHHGRRGRPQGRRPMG